jgi:hypothetical protein
VSHDASVTSALNSPLKCVDTGIRRKGINICIPFMFVVCIEMIRSSTLQGLLIAPTAAGQGGERERDGERKRRREKETERERDGERKRQRETDGERQTERRATSTASLCGELRLVENGDSRAAKASQTKISRQSPKFEHFLCSFDILRRCGDISRDEISIGII